jgi:hypothetical protein
MTCQCCASPLGEKAEWKGTTRLICAKCLGFWARWMMELNNAEVPRSLPQVTPAETPRE